MNHQDLQTVRDALVSNIVGTSRCTPKAHNAIVLIDAELSKLENEQQGKTNSGDETKGTVKRFGFDITNGKSDIIPATNGAYVHYSDYLKLFQQVQAVPSHVWAAISKTHMMLFADEAEARKMQPTATSPYDVSRYPVYGSIQSPQDIKAVSYAGVRMWLGDKKIEKFITEFAIRHEIVAGTELFQATQECLDALAEPDTK